MQTASSMQERAQAQRQAQELELDAARYPDQRGEILLDAAYHWQRAGEVDRAAALLGEVLTLGGEDAQFARHSLADLGFKQGADDEAWEHLRQLQEMAPLRTGPATLVGEMLETRGEYQAALDWYERALQNVDVDAIATPGAGPSLDAGVMLGRQRCRASLGLPVDELDRAADIAQANRQEFADRLDRFLTRRPAVTSRPAVVRMLVWQRAEQLAGVRRWPEAFDDDLEGYYADIEKWLREASADRNVTRITLVLGSADDFAEYLRQTGDDPAEESVRLAYAEQARIQGRVMSWPPARNQLCWCGSRRKYKKCCGAPTTAR